MIDLKKVLISGCAALLLGCGGVDSPDLEKNQSTADDVKKEVSEAYETTTEYVADKREEIEATLTIQYRQLKGEVEELRVTASEASEASLEELNLQKEKLLEQLENLGPKFDQLKVAGEETWSELLQGIRGTLDEIRKGFQDLKEKETASDS